MRFIAIDSVSCASGLSAPSEMPGATRRLRISVMLSTSSTGIGLQPSVRKSSRSRSAIGGSLRTASAVAPVSLRNCRWRRRSCSSVDQRAVEARAPRRRGAACRSRPPAASTTSASQACACRSQHLARDAGEADAGDARLHAGEELRDQRARQPDRLEIVAAAIGGDHGDAHLGHDLQQPLVDRLLVALRSRPSASRRRTGRGGGGRRCVSCAR